MFFIIYYFTHSLTHSLTHSHTHSLNRCIHTLYSCTIHALTYHYLTFLFPSLLLLIIHACVHPQSDNNEWMFRDSPSLIAIPPLCISADSDCACFSTSTTPDVGVPAHLPNAGLMSWVRTKSEALLRLQARTNHNQAAESGQ